MKNKLHLYVEGHVEKKCVYKSDIEWPCENLSEKILSMCDALRDLVPFVQFKKREKHPWRSVTYSKVEDF